MEHVSTADGIAGDHGDDGFGDGADFFLEVQHIETGHAVRADVAGVAADFLITAGAEGEVTGPGEDDDADGGVFVSEVKSRQQFLHGQRTEGIAHFGPVDRDFGNAIFGFVIGDVGEVLDVVPHGGIR